MHTASLKEKLLDKLKEIEDPALLAELSNLFEIQEPESVYKVNPAQKKSIEKAMREVTEGLIISNTQADKEIQRFLKSS